MHSQSPQRQQIQIKGNCDTDVWRTDGSQRNGSCNGPGDHPVKPEIIKKGVVTGESNAVLPYNEENTFKGRFSWENTDTCYVKNVLLSGLRIKIPYLVDGVILKGAVINIFNREFIPNVSRNNISASQQEKLSYAIGKAIHLWIRDHAELSTEQKALLDVFIETKYKETNYCLR